MSKNISKSKPLHILDLDLTIIGNVKFLLDINVLYNNTYNKWFIDKDTFIKMLADGLLRPGFKDYIKTVYNEKIIVIYTLSNKIWADFVIDCIQEYIGIKFVSLLLTLEDSINNIKSIKTVLDKLAEMNIEIDIDKINIFDDNPNYTTDYKYTLHKVKAYNYSECKFINDKKYYNDFLHLQNINDNFNKVATNYIIYFLQLESYYIINFNNLDDYIKMIHCKNILTYLSDNLFTTIITYKF